MKPRGTPNERLILKLCRTKYEHWNYEEEYRVFVELTDEDEGKFFINFEGNMELKEVIVGANSSISRTTLNSSIGSVGKDVSVFKARAGFTNFEMVKNKDQSMWP